MLTIFLLDIVAGNFYLDMVRWISLGTLSKVTC